MQVEQRPLAEIRPYENNPRDNDAAVDAVAESIRRFGFRQPIVVDAEGVIVVGHTRWKAAQKLGLQTVPVHVATDLTPEQIRAYRIADNKTDELGRRAFQRSLQAGENVLGLFGRSGSTPIAAEQTGRRAFLMELDPLYCDVIVKHMEELTSWEASAFTHDSRPDDSSARGSCPGTRGPEGRALAHILWQSAGTGHSARAVDAGAQAMRGVCLDPLCVSVRLLRYCPRGAARRVRSSASHSGNAGNDCIYKRA